MRTRKERGNNMEGPGVGACPCPCPCPCLCPHVVRLGVKYSKWQHDSFFRTSGIHIEMLLRRGSSPDLVGTRKPCGNAHSRRRRPPPPHGAFENFKLSQKSRNPHTVVYSSRVLFSLFEQPTTDNRQPTTHGHLPPPFPLSFFLRPRPLSLPQ